MNNYFTPSQAGSLPGDSYIIQVLSIIHEIQTTFDNNPSADVRGAFLDILKAFDNIWHGGFLFRLQYFGFEGELLALFKDYLENREERVVLNHQMSEWRKINSGVQGLALGPQSVIFHFHK